jgi:hypothetical protein
LRQRCKLEGAVRLSAPAKANVENVSGGTAGRARPRAEGLGRLVEHRSGARRNRRRIPGRRHDEASPHGSMVVPVPDAHRDSGA